MNQETLRKVQLVQLEICKEIDRICRLNHISYFLDSGSVLGAVRHKGFIPWDDDLDLGMFYQEYRKFIEAASRDLDPKYRLIEWNSDPDYGQPMLKVIKRGTVYKELKRFDHGEQGIWVDVFAYYPLPEDRKEQDRFFRLLKPVRAIIRLKSHYKTWVSFEGIDRKIWLKNLPLRFIGLFLPRKALIRRFEKLCGRYAGTETGKIFCCGIERDYHSVVFDRELFASTAELPFEDTVLPVPGRYREYLTRYYGNYMELPPEEKRLTGHLITQVSFGDENA